MVDRILDKTGMKGTGKWTVQQAADLSVAMPTVAAALDSRFLSGIKVRAIRTRFFVFWDPYFRRCLKTV